MTTTRLPTVGQRVSGQHRHTCDVDPEMCEACACEAEPLYCTCAYDEGLRDFAWHHRSCPIRQADDRARGAVQS